MKEEKNIGAEKVSVIEKVEKVKTEELQAENGKEKIVYKGYVGFWKRFAALALDLTPSLILGIVFMGVFWNQYWDFIQKISISQSVKDVTAMPFMYYYIFVLVISLAIMIYHAYLYFKHGQGIGYKILNFRIIDQKTGLKPKKRKLFVRWIYKYAPLFVMLAMFTIWAAFSFIGVALSSWINTIMMLVIAVTTIAFYIWPLVLAITIGASDQKRGLHDKWSKTIVVREKDTKKSLIWTINLLFIGSYILMYSFIGYQMYKDGGMMEKAMELQMKNEIYNKNAVHLNNTSKDI